MKEQDYKKYICEMIECIDDPLILKKVYVYIMKYFVG